MTISGGRWPASPSMRSVTSPFERTTRCVSEACGKLMRRYRDVTPTPITAICFDDRERKLLVADHSGMIVVLNYQNGAVMKAMESHAAEVAASHARERMLLLLLMMMT